MNNYLMRKLVFFFYHVKIKATATFSYLFVLTNLLYFFSYAVLAQDYAQKIEYLSAKSGLNNAQVYAVAKDKQGFLWFGTADGIKRFDGYSFSTFRHQNDQPTSLSNDNVGVMLIDSKDRLWAGTWGGGVNLYQRKTQSFIHFIHNPKIPTSIGADKVQALFEDRDGAIWIGTNGGGLNLYHDTTNTFTRYTHDPKTPYSIGHNRIWSIAQDSKGNIWAATSNGLYRLDQKTERFTKFGSGPKGIDHSEVRVIHIDKNDNIWIATRLSFGQLNVATNQYTPYIFPDGSLPSITRIATHQNALLLSTFAGIFRFDLTTAQFVPAAKNGEWALLGNRDVRQVLVDSTGLLWAATRYSGVIKVFKEPPGFHGWKNYLQEEKLAGLFSQVMSIAERADGRLWLGTGRGLVTFDGKDAFVPHLSKESLGQLLRLRVHSIAKTSTDALYVGTDNGVFHLKPPLWQLERVTMAWQENSRQAVDALTLDQQDRLWLVFASARKVTRWDPSTKVATHYLEDIDPVFTFIDQQGIAWIGTAGEGLYRIIPGEEERQTSVEHFLPDNKKAGHLSDKYLNAAIQTDPDTLWFATKSGIDRYSKSKNHFTNFSIDMDGIEVSIQSMSMDADQMLWLATSQGVFRLEPDTGVFHHFSVNDGLNSNSFLARSMLSTTSGKIYFGSIDGVTGFDPKDVNVNTVAPPVVITNIKVDGKSLVPLPDTLSLSPDHKTIEINFAALDFQASEDNQYRTRLKGIDEQWSELTGSNSISFARLQPDTYIFEVIGSNNHGIWNKNSTQLKIVVLPAWYQTTLFKVSAPLIVFVLLFIIYALRVRQHKATEKFLSEQVEQRTQDIFVLGDVGKDIAATFDIEGICQKIYMRLNSALPADTFAIGLFHETSKQIEFIFVKIKGEQQPNLTVDINNNKPASWSVSNQKEFVAIEPADWQRFSMSPDQTLNGQNTRSVICQPLMAGNTVIGVMTLQSDQYFAFDNAQINILRIIASHTAIALSNSLSFKELAKAEARLELAMSGANAGMWEWNTQTDELITSEIWSNMLGYKYQEFEQKYNRNFTQITSLIHPEDKQKSITALQEHLSGKKQIYRNEYRLKTAYNQWKWILSIGRATEDPNNPSIQRVLGIHLDINESKQMETVLKEAKERAEIATQTKSDFLSNMSHEIRTPMNAIIGMSYLALQTDLNLKQRNYINKVHNSAESLLRIINDILDFSKIEAGKLDIEEIEFSLDDVLNNLANAIALKAEEKEIDLYFDFDNDVPNNLIGDPLRLGQILLNLGSNAVKFTTTGGEILVAMSTITNNEDGVKLRFSVKDNGIGMSEEQQAKLFKSFSQADASTTRRFGGTGLGLAISKTLAELMHGNIWVDSKLEQGSTFHFTVCLGKQAEPFIALPHKSPSSATVNILLVDNSPLFLEILSNQLKSFGFNVELATSGEQAITTLKKSANYHPFDVVIIDRKISKTDDMPLIDIIQNSSMIIPHPKIILLTSHSDDKTQINEKIAHTLVKPVTPSTLLEAVSYVIGDKVHKNISSFNHDDINQQAADKLRGAKVLLVEDNDMNQELATELLRNAEITVTLAENGKEALNALEKQDFDGILMDCQMPVMDGYSATKAIRQMEKYEQLPIIAMTANAMAGDRERAISAGMNDHIAKPLNVKAMFATIAKWISPSSSIVTQTLTPSSQQNSQELPELTGIDTQTGLATAAGDTSLYKRLLLRFKAGQKNFVQDFEAAVKDPDKQAAERIAHTLKGAAANIGAKAVVNAAAILEQLCHTNTTNYNDALQAVAHELNTVIASLEQLDSDKKAVHDNQPKQLEHVTPLLEKLTALLRDYDTDAVEVLEKLMPLVTKPSSVSLLNKVNQAVEDYDFELALATMDNFHQCILEEIE